MRKFKIIIETGIAGGDFEDEFEVDDDATPDEIHDEAKDIFFNYCNYSLDLPLYFQTPVIT